MNETHLTGLDGTNPLGFLAAIGVQVVFGDEAEQPRLWWSNDITPHAVMDGDFTLDRIADRALEVFRQWAGSPALTPRRHDGTNMSKGDELKLEPLDIRAYLDEARKCDASHPLPAALIAEGSLDNQGVAKPSDLYFTAGQQKFLDMARQILEGVMRDDIFDGLAGPWRYEKDLPSLMWDIRDDRVYALTANNPSSEKKHANPGVEALAILGMSLHPVFAGKGRTLTQGCSGKSWKESFYSWPLWRKPASPFAVKSLLAHVPYHDPTAADSLKWFRSWGVASVYRSSIRRSGQGGYGTFAPPTITWQAANTAAEGRNQ